MARQSRIEETLGCKSKLKYVYLKNIFRKNYDTCNYISPFNTYFHLNKWELFIISNRKGGKCTN